MPLCEDMLVDYSNKCNCPGNRILLFTKILCSLHETLTLCTQLNLLFHGCENK